jgi:hypothetical protein
VPGRRDGERKSFDTEGHFFGSQTSVKGGRYEKGRERSLTYSFPCAVFTVPGVSKYGIGQFLAESHVKIPQLDLPPFEPLPGSIVSPTATDEGRMDRGERISQG